jgi:hypothetical protein
LATFNFRYSDRIGLSKKYWTKNSYHGLAYRIKFK